MIDAWHAICVQSVQVHDRSCQESKSGDNDAPADSRQIEGDTKMKQWTRAALIVVGAMTLLVQAAISFWTPAQAQLGNSGVPVSCSAGVISSPALFTCTAADGTAFVNNRVPNGYYLHVTDVIV